MKNFPTTLPATTLYELLAAHAHRDPEAVAILAPGRDPLSFGAMLDQIDEVRTILNGWGLGRGDRIALLAGRGPETAVAALAIASCAVCAPLNAAGATTELEQGLTQTGAKALLVPANAPGAVRDLSRRIGMVLLEYSVGSNTSGGRFRLHGGQAAAVAQGGPAAANDLAFIMRTSGTTARSKIVPVSHNNIVARTDKTRRLFSLTPADRCLNPMPLCYSHGVNNGLMGPLAAGCSTICPPAFDRETFLACVRDFDPTYYTASFTYHQAIFEWLEQQPDALAGHRLRFVRAGSGPLPTRARVGLERVLGAPVLEIYGSTETGTIAGNPPVGIRKPTKVGISPDNDIAIMDVEGNLLSPDMVGEVVVRGATVFGGYENDAIANRRVFHNGWYRTGDQGFMDAEGYLKLMGRLDEVINRGGEKIAPQQVDEALLQHDAVVQAVSFPVPHRTLHHELAAAVVLRSGVQVTEDELRKFLSARLTPFKIPRRIICTSELPKGPTGKLARTSLAEHFGLAFDSPTSTKAQPQTKIQETLLTYWRDVLRSDDIGCDDDFFLLGGNSITAVDLILRIEEGLQYRLPMTILAEAPTVRKLEARLERMTLGANNNTIRVNGGGERRPLFALFGRYGHVLRLLPVLRSLGPDQAAYGLQPPNMNWANVGCVTIPQMAADYIGEVKAVQPQGPYSLFGVSFGGIIVFEMALQLQRAGESVELLAMNDTGPPTCRFVGSSDVPHSLVLPDPEPENWVEDLNNRVAETHLRARSLYVLDTRSELSRFRGELTYIYCTGNPIAVNDRRQLWQRFADRFKLVPVPGSHGSVHEEPQFTVLTNVLRACLESGSLPTCEPASVFDRSYRIEKSDQHERILSSTGDVYRVEQERIQGCVVAVNVDAQTIRIQGWAVEHCQRQPAQTIAVFLDDRFLGYGASGILRSDAAKHLPVGSTQYAGFDFYFWHDGVIDAKGQPRLFVLSNDNRAAELPIAVGQELMTWAELWAERKNSTAASEKMRAELDAMKNSTAASEKMRAELDAMKNSTCWRITKPLRQIRYIATTMRQSVRWRNTRTGK